jgi:hypothetical protein
MQGANNIQRFRHLQTSFLCGDFAFIAHAGRELYVELFDGEFAGDEAGKKQVAG